MCDANSKPQFEHDCSEADGCTFLGTYIAPANGPCDLYVHTGRQTTVIARYSSEGSDYQSGLDGVGLIDELTEAHRRAVERGILSDEFHLRSETPIDWDKLAAECEDNPA